MGLATAALLREFAQRVEDDREAPERLLDHAQAMRRAAGEAAPAPDPSRVVDPAQHLCEAH